MVWRDLGDLGDFFEESKKYKGEGKGSKEEGKVSSP